jgi:hypothetical protein
MALSRQVEVWTMKAQWLKRFAGKRPWHSRYAALFLALIVLAGIAGCAANRLAEEFLLGIALGIAAAVALRVALNADPEE